MYRISEVMNEKILEKTVSKELEYFIDDDYPSIGLDTLTNYSRGLNILP